MKAYDVKKQETVELPYPDLVDESELVSLQIISDPVRENRIKDEEDDKK